MIVKVQVSISKPPMALVYDRDTSIQGEFPASELPDWVRQAVKKGNGRAYFRAKMVGDRIDIRNQIQEQGW